MWETLKTKLKGWRSIIWHSLVVASGGIIATIDQLKQIDWTQFVSAKSVAVVLAALGVIGIWLRLVTTGPVGEKPQ